MIMPQRNKSGPSERHISKHTEKKYTTRQRTDSRLLRHPARKWIRPIFWSGAWKLTDNDISPHMTVSRHWAAVVEASGSR